MLSGFFLHLKSFRLPVSTREFLTLLEALEQRVITTSLDDFHTLARACLVKDEQHFDRFDLAFGSYFKGVDALFDARTGVPEDWLRREFIRHLTEDDKARIAALERADAAKTPSPPMVSVSRDGLAISSADNAFGVRLRGYVQADGRFFGASGPGRPSSRARSARSQRSMNAA